MMAKEKSSLRWMKKERRMKRISIWPMKFCPVRKINRKKKR